MSPEKELDFQEMLLRESGNPFVDEALQSLFGECMDAGSAERPRSKRHNGRLPVYISAAAALCALVALPLSYRSGREAAREEFACVIEVSRAETEQARGVQWLEKKVPQGRVDSLMLADGTRLYLNSGSRITYPSSFEGDTRRVFVDGEVLACVTKDTNRPFCVQSGDVEVKVLGTTFDLKAYSDDGVVEACLLEGAINLSVQNEKGGREVRMKPGNVVQYDRTTGSLKMNSFDISIYKSFAQGRVLRFADLSMQDIARDLQRTFGVKVVVMDEKLSATRFFAIFTNGESLDEILRAMNRNHRMRITRRDGVVYLASL